MPLRSLSGQLRNNLLYYDSFPVTRNWSLEQQGDACQPFLSGDSAPVGGSGGVGQRHSLKGSKDPLYRVLQ